MWMVNNKMARFERPYYDDSNSCIARMATRTPFRTNHMVIFPYNTENSNGLDEKHYVFIAKKDFSKFINTSWDGSDNEFMSGLEYSDSLMYDYVEELRHAFHYPKLDGNVDMYLKACEAVSRRFPKALEKIVFKTSIDFYKWATNNKKLNHDWVKRFSEKVNWDEVKSSFNKTSTNTIKVGKNEIKVRENFDPKKLDKVKKSLNVAYRIMKRTKIENVWDNSDIIIGTISSRRAAGLYYSNSKELVIDPRHDTDRFFIRVIIHEIGHKIDYEYFSSKDRKALEEVYSQAKKSNGKNAKIRKDEEFKRHMVRSADYTVFKKALFSSIKNTNDIKFYWNKSKNKKYGLSKGEEMVRDVLDMSSGRQILSFGKEGARNKPFGIVVTSDGSGDYMGKSHEMLTKGFVTMTYKGRPTTLQKLRRILTPKTKRRNGDFIYDDSWFVTEYARTNVREFWAEMFASVLMGEKVDLRVRKFVLNIIKGI